MLEQQNYLYPLDGLEGSTLVGVLCKADGSNELSLICQNSWKISLCCAGILQRLTVSKMRAK